jgi:predicted component of type VI protein secretion system
MTVNIPRMLDDHAEATLDELDREITALVDRLTQLVQHRATIETHLRVQAAFSRPAEPAA